MKKEIGIVGLGVMGKSIAQNFADKGYRVVGYNSRFERTKKLMDINSRIEGVKKIEDLVAALATPKKILMMVPAGDPVDQVMSLIIPLLKKGDILLDGGNSHFKDTARRSSLAASSGIHFLGLGVSGGEKGALTGPSMMLGGEKKSALSVLPMLKDVAAQDPAPCVDYLGKDGAGHFVKMIHNGIEYAEMEAIAEVYFLAKKSYGLDDDQMVNLFERLFSSDLSSYLLEITVEILKKKDDLSEGLLLDKISDKAKSKGTGRWTVEYALENGVSASTITAALDARIASSQSVARNLIQKEFQHRDGQVESGEKDIFDLSYNLLFFSKMIIYSQGVELLNNAKEVHGFEYNISPIFKIWRNGCIIRSQLLDAMGESFDQSGDLLTSPVFSRKIIKIVPSIREIISQSLGAGATIPVLVASLQYFEMMLSTRLPTALVQAQRDFFGAHTYERIDREGVFHTIWE